LTIWACTGAATATAAAINNTFTGFSFVGLMARSVGRLCYRLMTACHTCANPLARRDFYR
jgi:hypothetical protein